ncbi:quercetin dioxygenase-like cupin family protein [Paraburkholderia sp. WC7.3g]|uniref:Cupin domain-containing protein n=1 Tax=Paraburkholderia podalyriae TaxID=1938811 RepID=A0ABR7PPP0_9BURK|nr:cupin domain-containing protein [Paraburkholderia podalyriae]
MSTIRTLFASALLAGAAIAGTLEPADAADTGEASYVLSGAIRSRVDNGAERIYHAGESWTEKPGAHHRVSENASTTEPAKLLAIFVADTNDPQLVTFDKK